MAQRAYRLLLPLAALLAVLPMLLRGPSCGHDFDFHLLSWLEASTQLAHGGYPHWAYTPAWNAGEPRFLFYPPLSWLLGALLGALLPWTAVPAAFTWVALTLSGFSAHALVRRYAPPGAALFAAVLYLANPYMLFTAYERTAYGELLAAAILPLLFAAALAAPVRLLPLAVPIALLWLTNVPAAVMGCYALALLMVLRLAQPISTRLHLARTAVAATALGLALPAFFLLPAAYERRYIQSEMAVVGGMQPADNTLFHHMLPATDDTVLHDVVLHTASTIALLLLGAIALLFALSLYRRTRPSLPLLGLTAVVAFLLTPWSLPLWRHIPELAFLQFPWRLCALLAPVLAILTAQAVSRIRPIYSLLPVLLILPAWQNFHQPCDAEDSVPARTALFHSPLGTEATDEYTPADADADQLHPHDPPYWLLPATGSADAPATALASPGPAPDHLTLDLPAPEFLVLNRRQYPAWQIRRNGAAIAPYAPERDDGLIALALPAGHSTIDLTFTRTPDRTLGLGVSLLALAGCVLFRRRLV